VAPKSHTNIGPPKIRAYRAGGNGRVHKIRRDQKWKFEQRGGLISHTDKIYISTLHVRFLSTSRRVVDFICTRGERKLKEWWKEERESRDV